MRSSPEFTKKTHDDHLIKDWSYYKSQEFLWNNPARASPKNYQFYYKVIDDNLPRIQTLEKLEEDQKKFNHDLEREKYLLNILKSKSRLTGKKSFTRVLQSKSGQYLQPLKTDLAIDDIENDFENLIIKRNTITKNHVREEFEWNKLDQASKKHVEMVIRPLIVMKEEKAVEDIRNRIELDKYMEKLKKEAIDQRRDEYRNLFRIQQRKNQALEKKAGLPMKDTLFESKNSLPTIQIDPTIDLTNFSTKFDTRETFFSKKTSKKSFTPKAPEQSSKLNSHSGSRSFLPNHRQASLVERLATIKQECEPTNEFDRHEYVGMLIKKADIKNVYSGNNLYDKLTETSKIFNQALETEKNRHLSTENTYSPRPILQFSSRSRFSGRILPKEDSKHTTFENLKNQEKIKIETQKTERQIDTAEDAPMHNEHLIKEEINQFERVYGNGLKQTGYPRIALEEAKSVVFFP